MDVVKVALTVFFSLNPCDERKTISGYSHIHQPNLPKTPAMQNSPESKLETLLISTHWCSLEDRISQTASSSLISCCRTIE